MPVPASRQMRAICPAPPVITPTSGTPKSISRETGGIWKARWLTVSSDRELSLSTVKSAIRRTRNPNSNLFMMRPSGATKPLSSSFSRASSLGRSSRWNLAVLSSDLPLTRQMQACVKGSVVCFTPVASDHRIFAPGTSARLPSYSILLPGEQIRIADVIRRVCRYCFAGRWTDASFHPIDKIAESPLGVRL